MGFLGKVFLRGLAAVLPLALTGYLVWAAVVAGEALLHRAVVLVLPEESYWPGLGFLLSVGLVMLSGLLMYSFVVRRIYGAVAALLARIPVVKSVFGMLVDVLELFGSGENRPLHRVVLVSQPSGQQQLGFLTRDDFADLPGIDQGLVAVYLPMSYQIGGFTVLVPRAQVREIEMSAEAALRFCVTAGVARQTPTKA